MNMQKKNILITGAAGLIGSQLLSAINSYENYNVIPCVRDLDQRRKLEEELGIPFYAWNVMTQKKFSIDEKISAIIHCATANDCISHEFKDGVDLSIYGTKAVLDFAVDNNVKRIFFLSTIQVYGSNLKGLISRDTPINCESAYSLNHFYGEELCRMYQKKYQLEIALIRPTNVYGCPETSSVNRETLVPTCFIRDILEDGLIKLHSNGKQCRNFISTNELAGAIASLLMDDGRDYDEVLVANLASNLNLSILDVANLVAEAYFNLCGQKIAISTQEKGLTTLNLFEVINDVNISRLSVEDSRKNFISEIVKLFIKNRG